MQEETRSFTSRQFGKYTMTGIAGAGGMGVVYEARDTVLGRTVALKFLPPAFEDQAGGRERFLREAVTASSLDHPNVGTVFGIEEHDGQRAIVLAYYSGGSLQDRLRGGPLPPVQALAIACGIASGLAAAHARSIVHRDIKPSNILFDANGIVKVVDFGLAKVWSDSDLTAAGSTLGTAGYMSPEQASGSTLGPQADVWALGVVLYEMLAGHRPFRGDSYAAVERAVLLDKPDLTGIPAEIAPVLQRALRKKVAERYASTSEMLDDLTALGESVKNRSELATVSIARPPRQSRGYRWLALACIVLAAGIGGTLLWRARGGWQKPVRQVVLLPLKSANDASLDPLGSGLASLVIDALQGAANSHAGLRLATVAEVDRTGVVDVAGARRSLGADTVVTLALVREGANLRATLASVNAQEGKVEASRTVTRAAADVARLQSDLVTQAAALLGLKPGPRVSSLARLQAASADAYQAYVRADGFLQGWKDSQNPDAAIPLLQSANAAAPGNAAVEVGLCEAFRLKYQLTSEAKWLDSADVPCRHAPEADPGFAPASIERGNFRVQRGDVQGGIEDLKHAVALDPSSEAATRSLAAAYDAAGLHEKAEATALETAKENPNSWSASYELGEIYLRSGEFEKAVPAYQRATQLAPGNNAAWTRLGSSLSQSERLPEAEKAFLQSLKIKPTFAAYSNLGNLYLRQERFAEAGVQYEKALEKNAKQDRIWGNLAAAYSRMPGKQDQSRDAYRRAADLCRAAVKATPDDAIVVSNLASYEAFTGERAEPLALIQKALALAPKDVDVLYNGAEVYEYLGFREQALLWIGKMLKQGFPLKDLERSVVLADLRKDARYRTLVAAVPATRR